MSNYSLFGNDELGWTVARKHPESYKTLEFHAFNLGGFYASIWSEQLTTKEKAEAKLKELQDEK